MICGPGVCVNLISPSSLLSFSPPLIQQRVLFPRRRAAERMRTQAFEIEAHRSGRGVQVVVSLMARHVGWSGFRLPGKTQG